MKLTVGFSTRKKKNILNYLIEWFDKAPFSHAFIQFEGMVFQATGEGVHIVPLKEFLSQKVILKEVHFNVTSDESLKYIGFVHGCIGKEYSQIQLAIIALSKFLGLNPSSENGTKRYICSELCADVLNFVLGITFPEPHDYITPRDLFDYIKSKGIS